MTKEVPYTIEWPNEAFILVLANDNTDPTEYTISYQYNDRDPDAVLESMTQEERDAYYRQKRIYEEESVEDTGTFWLFVGGGIVGLILIIVLIYCLVKMKKRNDLIVAKVEKMTAEQLQKRSFVPNDERNDDFYESQRKAALESAKKEKESSLPAALPFSPDEAETPMHKM